MSSQISGDILPELRGKIGSILSALLPAGSITGAPKPSTMQIIANAEQYDRGFYTGVMGEFDGKNVDSGVMIRFIEDKSGQMIFKSGGGITVFSELNKEYEELIQKVYLPFSDLGREKDLISIKCGLMKHLTLFSLNGNRLMYAMRLKKLPYQSQEFIVYGLRIRRIHKP
jgi:anthranilate/para-aminobenzoate synthase component I